MKTEIYKVIKRDHDSGYAVKGDLLLRLEDEYYIAPWFFNLTGRNGVEGKVSCNMRSLARIYPPEDRVKISLDGKDTYISRESAEALKKALENL